MPLTSTQEKRACYIACKQYIVDSGRCVCINNNINNMNFPWDKLEFKKVDPDKVAGANPFGLILDEVGQMDFKSLSQSQLLAEPKRGLKYQIKSYPDGSKYVIVEEIHSNLTFKLNSYEDLWILNQIHDVVKSAGWTVTVTIPFLIDSQADKRFDIDQPHGLKLVCEFLNGMSNFRYKIFHPHNTEVVEALMDKVEIIDNRNFVNSVLSSISEAWRMNVNPDNLVILLPDGGAYKWGVKLADKLEFNGDVVAAAKNRQYIDGHSKLVQQLPDYDFTGKDVLLLDDISIGGGTFKGLSKILRERNCGKLYLAVSHMTIQELGEDPVTNYFDKVFTTNSKFEEYFYLKEDDMGPPFNSIPENIEVSKLF